MQDLEITPDALHGRLAGDPAPRLLDVREPWEHAIAHLPGATLIPLNDLPDRWTELDPAAEWVVYCHHGVRSLYAARFLHQQGLAQARSLQGGIDAWSARIDPEVPRY